MTAIVLEGGTVATGGVVAMKAGATLGMTTAVTSGFGIFMLGGAVLATGGAALVVGAAGYAASLSSAAASEVSEPMVKSMGETPFGDSFEI